MDSILRKAKDKAEEDKLREKKIEEEQQKFDEDDIRSLLLADRVNTTYRSRKEWLIIVIREDKPRNGKEDEFQLFKKLSILSTLAKTTLLLIIIFSRPQWCRVMGTAIDVGY
jgi:hypothetical protein